MKVKEYNGLNIIENQSISGYTSFEVGGIVKYFTEVKDLKEFKKALEFSKDNGLKIIYLGDGTNIYFPDEAFNVFVIKNSIKGLNLIHNNIVEVYSGTSLEKTVEFFLENTLSGIEKLAGIPGTVGGAVFGNAGAFGMELKDVIEKVYSVDKDGEIIIRDRKDIRFGYRYSEYKDKKEFIYKIILKGKKDEFNKIKNEIEEIKRYRMKRLPESPPKVKSAGSFFKNIVLPDGSKIAVGKLLEDAGAKGLISGGAKVSEKHANFIINYNNASASDIENLALKLEKILKEKYSVNIEREVIFAKKLIK